MKIFCHQCGAEADKPAGSVNRSLAIGAPIYCTRKCCGLARRKYKTKSQKTEEKRVYDKAYQKTNRTRLKAQKHAYFQATYDPVKAAADRKKKMPRHVEYCRQPKYKHWKSKYDRIYRANKLYGPFAEAAMLTADLNREIKDRSNNYENKWQNQTVNKTQFRRRQART